MHDLCGCEAPGVLRERETKWELLKSIALEFYELAPDNMVDDRIQITLKSSGYPDAEFDIISCDPETNLTLTDKSTQHLEDAKRTADSSAYMGSIWQHRLHAHASALGERTKTASELEEYAKQLYEIARGVYADVELGIDNRSRKSKYDSLVTLASQVHERAKSLPSETDS